MGNAGSPAVRDRRTWWLIAVIFLPLLALPWLPPVVQHADYHAFADGRAVLGVPNFFNVASNLPFLLVGVAGLGLMLGRKPRGATLSWTAFFGAVTLVTFCSGWYHWAPDDAALVWDRLPMTVAFAALFVALVTEHLEITAERALLATSVAIGIGSVVWWKLSGDLRLYGWVQIAPFLAIATLLATHEGRYTGRYWLAGGFVLYALAKAAEFSDATIFEATSHALSGHTLKHVLAAGAPFCVYVMLKARQPAGSGPLRV